MTARVPSAVPEGLLYALTLFAPLAFGCVEPWSRAALEILAFLLALACFLRGRGAVAPAADWFWLVPASFAAFGLVQLMSPVPADLPRPAGPFTAAEGPTRDAVLLWAALAALVWSVPRTLATHEAARRWARVLFGTGVVLAALGLLQAATWNGKLYWVRPTTVENAFGPYYNRDHAANVLLLALAFGAALWAGRRREGAKVDGPTRADRWAFRYLGGGTVLVVAALVSCASRGAFLAIGLTTAVMLVLGGEFYDSPRDRRLRAAAGLALAVLIVLAVFHEVGVAASAGGRVDRSIALRLFIYGDARRWLADAPFFGTGLGTFETVYPSYQDFDLRALARHAHSDWIELALESGLFGLLGGLAAAAALALLGARAWTRARSREMRMLVGGALAAAAAFGLHALVDFPFQIPGNAALLACVAGFLVAAPLWKDKSAPRVRPEPPGAAASAAACAAFLVLAFAATGGWYAPDPAGQRALGSRYYDQAVDPPDAAGLRDALRLGLRAAALRPYDYRALSLTGAALSRLGRVEDARALLARSRLVRFTPVVVGEGDDESVNKRRGLRELKAIGLVPQEAQVR